MNPSAPAETLAASYVPEAAVAKAAATLTPEQTAAMARGASLKQTYEKTKDTDPLAGLKPVQEAQLLPSNILRHEAERRFDPKIDTDGRQAEAIALAEDLHTIAEKGIDGITDKTKADTIVASFDQRVLQVRPDFASLPKNLRLAIARDLLQRPELRGQLTGGLGEIFDPSEQLDTVVSRAIVEKGRACDEAEAERDTAKETRNAERETLADLQSEWNEFLDTNPDTKAPGESYTALESLHANYSNLVSARDVNTTDLMQLKGRAGFAALRQDVTQMIDNGMLITSFTNEQQQMQQIIVAERGIKKYNDLRQRLRELPSEISKQRDKVSAAERVARRAKTKLEEAREDLDEAKTPKINQERQTLIELESLLATKANEYLTNDITARQKSETTAINDRDEKTFDDSTKDRYSRITVDSKGRPIITYSKDVIGRDWTNALKDGPEARAKFVLLNNPNLLDDPSLPAAEKATRQQERAGLEQRLDTDKQFAADVSNRFMTNLIKAQRQIGHHFSEGEIEILARRGCEAALNNAIAADEAAKNNIDNIAGKAEGQSYTERLKKEYGNNWVKILASMLLIPVGLGGMQTSRLIQNEIGRKPA